MKYLRRELKSSRKRILKTIWTRLVEPCRSPRSKYKDKQEVQDTIDILKEAMAKNKPLEQVPEDMWKLIEF